MTRIDFPILIGTTRAVEELFCNRFNAFIPFLQTSTTARMIHVCIVEPALIDSIVSTAVVRLDFLVLDVKMYLVRLTQQDTLILLGVNRLSLNFEFIIP